jgi:hypothetical protein
MGAWALRDASTPTHVSPARRTHPTHTPPPTRDCANNLVVQLLTHLLFGLRQASVAFVTLGRVGRWLSLPLRIIAGFLQRPLNRVRRVRMLVVQQQPEPPHSVRACCRTWVEASVSHGRPGVVSLSPPSLPLRLRCC